ncbi:hypothetical protein [Mucilaginibacter pedocola]|uniref:hypothetical protein n=1 Tax=Mucilaginibacter pedocola TaxID=1792845 RepID=UPI0012DD01E0|nr:hypothetical protein [Mucilaginibacter pedocola]
MTNIDEIKEVYLTAAKIVAIFGDVYLPIFERIHQELKLLEQKHELQSVALELAKEI